MRVPTRASLPGRAAPCVGNCKCVAARHYGDLEAPEPPFPIFFKAILVFWQMPSYNPHTEVSVLTGGAFALCKFILLP